MEGNLSILQKQKKLSQLKESLCGIDSKLLSLIKELNWDYKKLIKEVRESGNMVCCTVNQLHKVPISKLKVHEKRCQWHKEGYTSADEVFPEYSGCGSFVTLTSENLKSIINDVFPCQNERVFQVPQTSKNFDLNFSREEKLTIYDHVISNTVKPKSFSDLFQPFEEKKEKKEMTDWERAAAERDAKRRRASYRKKVHSNCKTQTEILREVIDIQMEYLKESCNSEVNPETNRIEKNISSRKEKSPESNNSHPNKKSVSKETTNTKDKEYRRKSKSDKEHSNHKVHKRKSLESVSSSHSNSRSRSDDKYRKWKIYEGRSHSYKSGHSH